ncbi:unnamed protein product [Echinostoma caproni]|uniref:Endo/exonuclease/phosphatase domain-containing protein n=1 Tax=Echinostoma caproni TaxID=27848 RepID=A0A183AFB9_9TREM|nr:unnamed protein product [Echinostoma caproni]
MRGSVLLYYRNSLQCKQIEYPFAALDKLELTQQDIDYIGVVCRPPSSEDSSNENLLQTMSYFLSLNFTHVLVMGVFNCPKLSKVTTSSTPFERQLKQFLQSHSLYNHVKELITLGINQISSTLDQVLTNGELMVESIAIATPLGAVITLYFCSITFAMHL